MQASVSAAARASGPTGGPTDPARRARDLTSGGLSAPVRASPPPIMVGHPSGESMTQSTLPTHIRLMVDNVQEVDRLVEIHRTLGGGKRGRPRDVEVLNKSGVVLLVACWEAFVEEVARQAFDSMIAGASKPSIFPNGVLVRAGRRVSTERNPTHIWTLAGDGWKRVLKAHATDVMQAYTGSFNTPSSKNTETLFEGLLGLKKAPSAWHWPAHVGGCGNEEARQAH